MQERDVATGRSGQMSLLQNKSWQCSEASRFCLGAKEVVASKRTSAFSAKSDEMHELVLRTEVQYAHAEASRCCMRERQATVL